MNKHILLSLAGLFSLSLTAGAIDIPRSVHRTKDIAKATEEATTDNRGILWVLSDESLKPT